MKAFDKEKFGQRLRLLIEEKPITQKDLAEHLGVTEKAVCDWIKGRKEPRFFYIEAMSEYLNCDIHYLSGKTNSNINWEKYDEEHRDILSEINHAFIFYDYLKSIGFVIEVISDGADKEIGIHTLTKGEKVIQISDDQFNEFQKSIARYVEFEFSKLTERKE